MKRVLAAIVLSLLAVTACMTGCLGDGDDDGRTLVMTTIVPLGGVIEAIGGDHVDVLVMVPEGQSPHAYEPVPSQMAKASVADMYFMVGSGLDFEVLYMDTLQHQNDDMRVVDCSEAVNVKDWDDHYGAEGAGSGTDPHIWTSLRNLIDIASLVKQELVTWDPINATDYESGFQTLSIGLSEADDEVSGILDGHEGDPFLIYHPSFGYFADDYDLRMISIEEGGLAPGAQGIQSIVAQATELGVTTVFVSPEFDRTSADVIAEQIGGTVYVCDPLARDMASQAMGIAEVLAGGGA